MGASIQTPAPKTFRLGAWVSKSNNTIYQAATDGFVIGGLSSTAATKMLADGSTPPTAERQRQQGSVSSVASLVLAGDYWKVENCSDWVYWMPLEYDY